MNTINCQLLRSLIVPSKKYLSLLSRITGSSNHCSSNISTERSAVRKADDEFEFDDEPSYKIEDYDAITDGDPEKLQCLKLYQSNFRIMAQQGEQVPSRLSPIRWRRLLSMKSLSERKLFIINLWMNEKWRSDRKKFFKKKSGPKQVNIFQFAYLHKRRHFYNYKLLQAMMFGPEIIIDMGYEDYMSHRELMLCATEIVTMWYENRSSYNPFYPVFCNVKLENSVLMSKLKENFCEFYNADFPATFTGKSYLDLYPKENIVYLTPHCTEELLHFDSQSVYVIGATADINKKTPLSCIKATKDGIRVATFPLDRFVNATIRKRVLSFQQSLAIMNDLKNGNDWPYALRHYKKLSENDLE